MATQTYTDGVTLTAAAEFNKFDTAAYPQLTGVAGTNTITATGPANLGLTTSPLLWFIPAGANTGATTLNITPSGGAALGAKNLFWNGAACVGGELAANVPAIVAYDGTQYNLIAAASGSSSSAPTMQVFTSGTAATYTRPAGVIAIKVRMVGGGGGGAATNTNNGANGTASTWSGGSLSAGGGTGGSAAGGGAGGAGGVSSNGDINIAGGIGVGADGGGLAGVNSAGGAGGVSVFGGAGSGTANAAGSNAAANSGSGGGGGGGTTSNAGSGGGSGGYVEKLIASPAATYTYTVGAGGNGGAAGGMAGGNGAAGIIIVDEFY